MLSFNIYEKKNLQIWFMLQLKDAQMLDYEVAQQLHDVLSTVAGILAS